MGLLLTVSGLLAPLIIGVLTFCGNALYVKINYMCKLQDNLDFLRNALNELLAKKNDVLTRVSAEELNNGVTRLATVSEWLSQVDTIITNTNQLIVEACGQDTSSQDAFPVHQRESTSCCWSTDNISNCCLGEKVFKKLDEVINLKTRGEFVEVTLQQAPIHVVETTGEGNSQCSMIYARRIDIVHSEKPINWTWSSYEPPNEVAILNEVCWLDISGQFHTRPLTQYQKYEVVFVVKFEENAYGWGKPVNLSLELFMRDKSENLLERTLYLDYYNREWVDIKAGDFVAPPKDASGKISFRMFQTDDNVGKAGLVVKGVAIRAVN